MDCLKLLMILSALIFVPSCSSDDDDDSSTDAATSATTNYGSGNCSQCISLPKSTFSTGEETTITWNIAADNVDETNWIYGYAAATTANNAVETDAEADKWLDEYIAGETGTFTFTVPETAGTYEIRLHYADDYTGSAEATDGESDLTITVE
ncbi:MAG: hypothetical protein AB8G05_04765 [Oligoflexales bacterium]